MRDVVLEHLVVFPRGGLCNRMRAIASAKRLAELARGRCTIVWDWGDYRDLFDDDTDWVPYAPPMDWKQNRLIPGYHHIRHLLTREGGTERSHRVPLTTNTHIALISWFVFFAAEERWPRGRPMAHVLPWFPRPHPEVLSRVETFRQAHMPPGTAGIHIRRTDNTPATALSPDEAYFKEADRLARAGYTLFVATDNEETLRMMQRRYSTLIHYPKRSALEQRWPKKGFQLEEMIDDMVDLWLLASCDLVIGSIGSSYSRAAVLLNGSPDCKLLDRPVLERPQRALARTWRQSLRRVRP